MQPLRYNQPSTSSRICPELQRIVDLMATIDANGSRVSTKRSVSVVEVDKSPKRSKICYADSPSGPARIVDGRAEKKNSGNSPLTVLQELVREISNDPGETSADPGVMRAISNLADVVRGARMSLSMKLSPSSHSDTPSSTTSGAPTAPSIRDEKLEAAVFTHPAMSNSHNVTYDRLEILGDAYIELVATKIIWERFPDLPAGRISQIREILVKNETLSGFAERFGFDKRVSVPPNYNTPSKRWTKTKGDVFEAYIAAIILSHPVRGYQLAETWLSHLWTPILDGLGHQTGELRAKEALAKKIMGKNVKLEYLETRSSVQQKGGTQTFFIAVYLTGWGWNKRLLGSGQGLSKAAAGDDAARRVLQNNSLVSEIVSAKESARLSA